MKQKLRLNLEELQVETFHTGTNDGRGPGTVFGQSNDYSLADTICNGVFCTGETQCGCPSATNACPTDNGFACSTSEDIDTCQASCDGGCRPSETICTQ